MTSWNAGETADATRVETRVALSIVIAVVLVGAAWSIANHFAFGTKTFDSGVIDHALWRVTHGFSDVSTINGRPFFSDHPAPLLGLLFPVYWMAPVLGLPALFALRAVSAGLVVWAAWLLALRYGLDQTSRWTLVLATALGPGMFLVLAAETNTVGLIVGPLALACAFALRREHLAWFGVMVVLVAAARPEVALGVVLLGWLLRKESPPHARVALWVGAIFTIGGVAWLLTIGDAPGFSGHLGHLGDSLSSAVVAALRRPWDALEPLLVLMPWTSLLIWLAGFGLLAPILGARWLLPAVPLLAIPFLGVWESADYHIWQYWHLLLPLAMVAAVTAVGTERITAKRFQLTVWTLVPAMWLLVVVPIGPALIPTKSAEGVAAAQVIAVVDDGSYTSVSAPAPIVPHLSRRSDVHNFPYPFACKSVIAGYTSPNLLPEAVVLYESQVADWEPRLHGLGYAEVATIGAFAVWATPIPQPAPVLECNADEAGT